MDVHTSATILLDLTIASVTKAMHCNLIVIHVKVTTSLQSKTFFLFTALSTMHDLMREAEKHNCVAVGRFGNWQKHELNNRISEK